ncbi:TlpA family protein disulfide reductase [Aquimarina agarivorans]|uniref:TlpA family protein disulfide reductase n=1 Tax=Aquimarina agarivorans TaxID=980584 RepID=UPI000248E5B5|nr:redoxin domain-containing protein [Aquimarina agarivorans]
MKIKLLPYVLFFITLISNAQTNNTALKVGDEFPYFDLKTIDGYSVTSDDIQGKLVFFNLWFIHCKPCIDELPELNTLKNHYEDDVVFISATFETENDVKQFLLETRFNFEYIATDAGQFLKNEIGNISYPKNFIIDYDGTIKAIKGGLPVKTVTTLDNKIVKKKSDFTYFAKYLDNLINY